MTLWLASVVPRRVVRTRTLFAFLVAIAEGASVANAWRRVSRTTLRTGYRTRDALALAGPAIRTALLSRAPPPIIANRSPDAQLVAHLRAALGDSVAPFDRFQLTFQRSLLPCSRSRDCIRR